MDDRTKIAVNRARKDYAKKGYSYLFTIEDVMHHKIRKMAMNRHFAEYCLTPMYLVLHARTHQSNISLDYWCAYTHHSEGPFRSGSNYLMCPDLNKPCEWVFHKVRYMTVHFYTDDKCIVVAIAQFGVGMHEESFVYRYTLQELYSELDIEHIQDTLDGYVHRLSQIKEAT